MADPRLLILGGGPAGLAVAYYAQRKGLECCVLEKENTAGGLCRTVQYRDHSYDLGAHRFHDRDPEITADTFLLLEGRIRRVDAPSRIYRWGRYIDFPLSPLNLFHAARMGRSLKMASDLFRARIRKRPVRTFEDYAINAFGKSLAETILLDYSEKLWGLPASRLSPRVATRRLSGFSLRALAIELLAGSGKTEHLDGSFFYPTDGYGAIVGALARSLPAGAVQTGRAVHRIEHDGRRLTAVIDAAGRTRLKSRDRVVASLPLSLLVRSMHPVLEKEVVEEAGRLRFRHIRLLYFRLNIPTFSEQATIYVSDPEIRVTRITEPRNRSPQMSPQGETGLAVEVPCFAGDSIQNEPDSDLARSVVAELSAAGLLDPAVVIDWQHRFLPNAYPIYDLEFESRVGHILDRLSHFENLDVVGRQGRFYYSHLHDQMRMARDLVNSLPPA